MLDFNWKFTHLFCWLTSSKRSKLTDEHHEGQFIPRCKQKRKNKTWITLTTKRRTFSAQAYFFVVVFFVSLFLTFQFFCFFLLWSHFFLFLSFRFCSKTRFVFFAARFDLDTLTAWCFAIHVCVHVTIIIPRNRNEIITRTHTHTHASVHTANVKSTKLKFENLNETRNRQSWISYRFRLDF